jgi:NADPH:quinone reductase-like Zn-dependent oxidoreductase
VGDYAQEMEVAARWLIRDETGLAPKELATIPLVLVTAGHAMRTLGRVGPGSQVLVQAGASGTGSMAIQIAKALGAQVVATASAVEKVARPSLQSQDDATSAPTAQIKTFRWPRRCELHLRAVRYRNQTID